MGGDEEKRGGGVVREELMGREGKVGRTTPSLGNGDPPKNSS